jgi:hypothetical protein
MLNQILEKKISSRFWILIITILLICFIGVSIPMANLEAELKSFSEFGVLELEFMWTVDQAEKIMLAWGPSGIEKEILVTWLDYIYMVCYGCFFAICNILIVRKGIEKQIIGLPVNRKYKMFIMLPIIDMLFDAAENVNLLIVLYGPNQISAVNPFLASLFASIKFGLLFLQFILFFVFLYWILRAKQKIV